MLAFDRIAAVAYGEFAARRRAAGKPVAAADAQIAAIARARGAALLATRVAGGLQGWGVRLVNPWGA